MKNILTIEVSRENRLKWQHKTDYIKEKLNGFFAKQIVTKIKIKNKKENKNIVKKTKERLKQK